MPWRFRTASVYPFGSIHCAKHSSQVTTLRHQQLDAARAVFPKAFNHLILLKFVHGHILKEPSFLQSLNCRFDWSHIRVFKKGAPCSISVFKAQKTEVVERSVIDAQNSPYRPVKHEGVTIKFKNVERPRINFAFERSRMKAAHGVCDRSFEMPTVSVFEE